MYQTSRSKGQELVAQRMVRYFRKLGQEAYLIASVYHDGKERISEETIGDKEYMLTNDDELDIPVIRVGSFSSKWPPRRILFKDSIYTLERIVNEFHLNVLITHSTLWNGPEDVAKFVEWRRSIKALGGYQDPLIFCHMSHFQEPSPRRYSLVERSFRIAWNRLSLKTIIAVANLILVVSPYERDAKMKLGAPRNKCFLFPGGIDDDSFLKYATSNPDELFEKLRFPRDAKIVAYIGTIEERKNPEAVLEVAERLADRSDIRFVIAGRGDSDYEKDVRRRAAELPNVTYLGEISEKEKVQLTEISYLNILLSRMEALGLSQLEFMSVGVPVITSGVGGQSWIVKDGKEGIHVDGPEDVEGAANAVRELVDNPSKRDRLSAIAKESANEFVLTKLIKNLMLRISDEIEQESGLSKLPSEVRATLTEPEVVARTWSHGTRRIAATNRRLFIQTGRLSRSTLEIPYSEIDSIEHVRRSSWKTLALGAIISSLLFIQHYLSPIISRTLTSRVSQVVIALVPGIAPEIAQIRAGIWIIPISLSLLLFLSSVRKGYALHGATRKPIYLSQSFRETIAYLREVQDQTASGDYAKPIIAAVEPAD
jgi:glycosyltransferase involved in cell wall biosynthesis